MPEAARHHADDGSGAAVQTHRAADDVGIRSEAAAPQCIAEQYRVTPCRGVFLGGKGAPRAGRMPSTSKKFAVTTPAATRSGPPSTINVALTPVPAAIASNT